MDTASFGGGNTFGLTLTNKIEFNLREGRHNLKDEIGDKSAEDIPVAPSVENGHVQDDNSRTFFFGDNAPLIENVRIISAEAVNAFDDKHVSSFKTAHKAFVLWSVKVFAALTVDENLVDAKVLKSDNLSVFVLVFARNSSVTENAHKKSLQSEGGSGIVAQILEGFYKHEVEFNFN